jgi:hypothetical protein
MVMFGHVVDGCVHVLEFLHKDSALLLSFVPELVHGISS